MIRKAISQDYDQIWEIFSRVIQTGDTYVFDENTQKKDLKKYWLASYMLTYVCVNETQKIVGTYILKDNQIGRGDHIVNGSYMVHPDYHGKGIGKKMGEHSIEVARSAGYLGIQFNIVVSTNTAAIGLWNKLGFKHIGTIPNGFQHKTLGFVDIFIMYLGIGMQDN